jgi:hypothetical protein
MLIRRRGFFQIEIACTIVLRTPRWRAGKLRSSAFENSDRLLWVDSGLSRSFDAASAVVLDFERRSPFDEIHQHIKRPPISS